MKTCRDKLIKKRENLINILPWLKSWMLLELQSSAWWKEQHDSKIRIQRAVDNVHTDQKNKQQGKKNDGKEV